MNKIANDIGTQPQKDLRVTTETAPLSKIDPSPHHHRSSWGDMVGLTQSIINVGIISPLVVRTVGKRFETICGERRRRGALKAELKEVPIIRRDDLTTEQIIEMQAVENLEREGVHPMDEAAYFEDLAKLGMAIDEIAKRFRRKKRDVLRSMNLLALGPAARKAFVAGTFDVEAAHALARGADVTHQKDALAALEAGSLQPEEVAGWVERTCMHSFTDAAWRLDDETVEPKAGACSVCPKQTNAQRDLFDEGQTGRCLDSSCWDRKMSRAYDKLVDLAERSSGSIKIYEDEATNLFIPSGARPAVARASGYVDSEAACPHLVGFTWSEAIAKIGTEPPTLYLIRDSVKRPRLLYQESVASKIVKRSDEAKKAIEERRAADPVREGVDGRIEGKIRREVVEAVAKLVVDSDGEAWVWIVKQMIDLVSKRAAALTAAQFNVDPDKLVGAVASNRKAKLIGVALMIREVADVGGEMPTAIREIVEESGGSLEQIEAACRRG